MLKLPEKKYEPKHNDELRDYAVGWNRKIVNAKCLCEVFGDEYAKERLLEAKKNMAEKVIQPYYKGQYDCVIEIERLNEEPEHRLDNLFQDSLDALDKLNIRGE